MTSNQLAAAALAVALLGALTLRADATVQVPTVPPDDWEYYYEPSEPAPVEGSEDCGQEDCD